MAIFLYLRHPSSTQKNQLFSHKRSKSPKANYHKLQLEKFLLNRSVIRSCKRLPRVSAKFILRNFQNSTERFSVQLDIIILHLALV